MSSRERCRFGKPARQTFLESTMWGSVGVWWGIFPTSQAPKEAPTLLSNGHQSSGISIEIVKHQSSQLQSTADEPLYFTSTRSLTHSEQSQQIQIQYGRRRRRQSISHQQAAARDDTVDSRQPVNEGASATRQPQASRKGTVPVRSPRQRHQYVNTRVHALLPSLSMLLS